MGKFSVPFKIYFMLEMKIFMHIDMIGTITEDILLQILKSLSVLLMQQKYLF